MHAAAGTEARRCLKREFDHLPEIVVLRREAIRFVIGEERQSKRANNPINCSMNRRSGATWSRSRFPPVAPIAHEALVAMPSALLSLLATVWRYSVHFTFSVSELLRFPCRFVR
ncbi:MAG: hypothetical protein HYU73_13905 [Betaproteobacteria bacterium]|nr:hypothetical protein [Betaproteobacteria bacterium]